MAVIVDELLELAVQLARDAGDLLLHQRPADLGVTTKSTPTDVVTAMDTAAERLIIDGIRGHRPGDGVLAEEGAAVASSTGVRWVVDPLDGTVNYLYGIPDWAVSIAVELDGATVVGVVHDPSKGLLYTAVTGRGAACNGRAMRCSTCVDLSQALVGTGFGYAADRRAAQAQVLTGVLPRVRDVRRIGAAALDLCSVAAGRLDGYYERGLKPWDLAAGSLIAREAGARVGGLHGVAAGPDLVIAAPTGLFGPLRDLLDRLAAADGP